MQLRILMIWTAVFALAVTFHPTRGDAQNRLPVTVVPNVGDLTRATNAMFSPDGQILAIPDRSGVKLWSVTTGRPLRILEYVAYFEAALFFPDGTTMASAHKDGSIRLWDVATGVNTVTLQSGADAANLDYSVAVR